MRQALAVPQSSWYVLRLANLSTMLREWVALHLAHTLPCRDALLGIKVRVLAQIGSSMKRHSALIWCSSAAQT